MPFYKRDGQELLCAPTTVSGPGFALSADTHADHTYPVEGWWWFNSLDEAMANIREKVVSVTKRQALQALIIMDLDEQVEAVLNSIPGKQGKLTRTEWKESNVVERERPLVKQMLTTLGLTETQGDELFTLAASL